MDLSPFSVVYTNSAGNEGGRIFFDENVVLSGSKIAIGFAKSPQYSDYSGTYYSYNFGSSGLASTAGKVELLFDGNVIDEVCWGKIECANNNAAFSTKEEDNFSLVRCKDGDCEGFLKEKYYPEIIESLVFIEPEVEEIPSCEGLIISEIYTYYSGDSSEQFIEIYNASLDEIDVSNCAIEYKNKQYFLSGNLAAGAYFAYRNSALILTKNPTTYNIYKIVDLERNTAFEVVYPHGQKKGASYSLFLNNENDQWLYTYLVTPGYSNSYQEFQTCAAGKIINIETGNCINEVVEKETICPEGKYLNLLTGRCKSIPVVKTTTCKEGYYLNPLTGRCKKKTTETTPTACKEGYERNPETNRCRKIQTATGKDYPIEIEEKEYSNPQIFIATGAVVALLLFGVSYACYQYRKEIKKVILRICRRNVS